MCGSSKARGAREMRIDEGRTILACGGHEEDRVIVDVITAAVGSNIALSPNYWLNQKKR